MSTVILVNEPFYTQSIHYGDANDHSPTQPLDSTSSSPASPVHAASSSVWKNEVVFAADRLKSLNAQYSQLEKETFAHLGSRLISRNISDTNLTSPRDLLIKLNSSYSSLNSMNQSLPRVLLSSSPKSISNQNTIIPSSWIDLMYSSLDMDAFAIEQFHLKANATSQDDKLISCDEDWDCFDTVSDEPTTCVPCCC